MARYRVHLEARVVEVATFEIEASSPEEANALALDAAHAGEVDWEFLETSDIALAGIVTEPIGD